MNSKIYISLILLFSTLLVVAQGDIDDTEVVIQTDKKIELPTFEREYQYLKFKKKKVHRRLHRHS